MSVLIDSSFGDDTPDIIIVLYSLKIEQKKRFNKKCMNEYFSTLI